MKAIRLPSGLKVGSQICRDGECTTRAAPVCVSMENSFAIHQLSSPDPWAPVAATAPPSGRQSYS